MFGFLAVLDVPINYGAIYWWETQHPKPVLGPRGGGADPDIKLAVYVSLFAFTIVYTWLLTKRLEHRPTGRRSRGHGIHSGGVMNPGPTLGLIAVIAAYTVVLGGLVIFIAMMSSKRKNLERSRSKLQEQ